MSPIAHSSGKIRPPTAKCGSTYCSWRLCSPIVIVSVCASAVAALALGRRCWRSSGRGRSPGVVAPRVVPGAAVVSPPPVVVGDGSPSSSSPPHAASSALSAAAPPPASSARRDTFGANPNPNVPVGSVPPARRRRPQACRQSPSPFPPRSCRPGADRGPDAPGQPVAAQAPDRPTGDASFPRLSVYPTFGRLVKADGSVIRRFGRRPST